RIMKERFGATNPKACALRFHAQTGGSTLTAQQPENNIVRVAVQALSAVAGGAQSIHTNSFDEALALPTERSARIALRTQQLLAHEAGGTATADPFGGSYFVASPTGGAEGKGWELMGPTAEQRQLERTARVRAERNAQETEAALGAVRDTARRDGNLLVPMREALGARATIGEICNVLREEFGMYDAQRA